MKMAVGRTEFLGAVDRAKVRRISGRGLRAALEGIDGDAALHLLDHRVRMIVHGAFDGADVKHQWRRPPL